MSRIDGRYLALSYPEKDWPPPYPPVPFRPRPCPPCPPCPPFCVPIDCCPQRVSGLWKNVDAYKRLLVAENTSSGSLSDRLEIKEAPVKIRDKPEGGWRVKEVKGEIGVGCGVVEGKVEVTVEKKDVGK